jgi:hypothetical protein
MISNLESLLPPFGVHDHRQRLRDHGPGRGAHDLELVQMSTHIRQLQFGLWIGVLNFAHRQGRCLSQSCENDIECARVDSDPYKTRLTVSFIEMEGMSGW